MDMFLYETVSFVCLWLSDEPVLFCIFVWKIVCICSHVGMYPGKISCKLTGSPSLNKVFDLIWFDLNWIDLNWIPGNPTTISTKGRFAFDCRQVVSYRYIIQRLPSMTSVCIVCCLNPTRLDLTYRWKYLHLFTKLNQPARCCFDRVDNICTWNLHN